VGVLLKLVRGRSIEVSYLKRFEKSSSMERFYTGWSSLVCTVVVAPELDNCSFGKLFSLTCTLPSGVIGVLDTKD